MYNCLELKNKYLIFRYGVSYCSVSKSNILSNILDYYKISNNEYDDFNKRVGEMLKTFAGIYPDEQVCNVLDFGKHIYIQVQDGSWYYQDKSTTVWMAYKINKEMRKYDSNN